MEGSPKQYLYHMVPKDMRQNEEGKGILYPLNVLKEKFPDLYELKAEKYSEPQGDDEKKNEARKSIPERLIPTLEKAAWGDVLNMTAVHPQELMDMLESTGFTPQEMKFYQIDPDLLDPSLATIYLYREDAGEKEDPKQYEQFDPNTLGEHSSLPEKTKEYYKEQHKKGERPLLFVGVPHILYNKHLDVSDIEQFPVVTATPIAGQIMSWEEYAKAEHPHPYIFELKKGDKELTYFGAMHSNDPLNPMFEQIKTKFAEAQPDSVFVEGWTHLEEIKTDPERYARGVEMMKSMSEEEVIQKYGEAGLGLKLAIEAGIDFYSPEPKFSDEIDYVLKQGFTKEEIFAEYVHRDLYQYYRNKEKTPVDEYLESTIIKSFKESSNWGDFDYSIANIQRISKEIWGDKGDIHVPDFSSQRTSPVPEEGFVTRITEVAQASSKFRDVYMVIELKKALKSHKKPFVIFGASHAYMQESALKNIFAAK